LGLLFFKTMNQQLRKSERISGKHEPEALFASRKSKMVFPLRMVYRPVEGSQAKVLVSVAKKRFKHAVDRNLLKRRIREAYRLHKPNIPVHIAFIYLSTEIYEFDRIEAAVLNLLNTLPKSNGTN